MIPWVEEITDEDISWVSELMKLENIVGSRREFLRSLSSVDVTACPGSGKTTLLVAKLGLLSKKWETSTAGVCVLSHTNVAKDEISDRLGGSEVGPSILAYPNFIGTIHGFTNRFLTTPYLISAGYRATTIDDEATAIMRRQALPAGEARTLEDWLARTNRSIASLRLSSLNLNTPLSGQDFKAGEESRMYRLATTALSTAAKAGFFCYDEILTLGYLFAKSNSDLVNGLRARFPVVLVDEMQDTSPEQNRVIREVFSLGEKASVIQRVGDLNQAIYGDVETHALLDFPAVEGHILSLDHSYRFDDSIARLVNGLAVAPILPDGLRGVATPDRRNHQSPHKLFIFPDDDPTGVLDAFGKHVVSVLPPETLAGANVWAVGGVNRPYVEVGPGHSHYPKSVSHYWGGYQANAAKGSYRPSELVEYFIRASAKLATDSSSFQAVNVIAEGLSRLANLMALQHLVGRYRRQHLHLTQLLATRPEALRQYQNVVGFVLSGGTFDSQEVWNSWVPAFIAIAQGAGADTINHSAETYLCWRSPDSYGEASNHLPESVGALNTYRYCDEDGRNTLDIHLGSVHSVKGETHTATLLLDTFYYEHHLAHLMPWLTLRSHSDQSSIRDRTAMFMRWAYVALSRPSHIACIALPERSLKGVTSAGGLTAAGWSVDRL